MNGKIKNIIDIFLKYSEKFRKMHIGAYAAQSAFFIIMSFIPITLLVFTILSITTIENNALYSFFENIMPDVQAKVSDQAYKYHSI